MSTFGGRRRRSGFVGVGLAVAAMTVVVFVLRAEAADAPAASSSGAATATKAGAATKAATPASKPAQKHFETPEAATDALVAAARASDPAALLAVLGREAKPIISSGDEVADENARERFLASYDETFQLAPSDDDSEAQLVVGKDGWPFPIPIVKDDQGWFFDTPQGKEEILDRRIGANELATIQVCEAYVDAQLEYAQRVTKGDEAPQYAQRLVSTPGKRDGLYWASRAGEPPSPLGPLMARARGEGYSKKDDKPVPYHGYDYRILTKQGPEAAGGAYDYIVRGRMIGGFALVAYPAEYGVSGVMTFLVNHDGAVYEKDLGPNTAEDVKAMRAFNPDSSWTPVPTS